MICPKCNLSNDDKYSFCLQCGAALIERTEASSEPPPTVLSPSDRFSKTELLPPDKIPPTVQYSNPQQTREQQNSPTTPIEVPPTVFYTPDQSASTAQQTNPQLSATQQYVPTKSVEFAVSPKLESKESETAPKTQRKSKTFRKIFLIAGIFILLLLVGGGVAVFFFAQPMQADKSYVLTDKHETKDNVLSFDNQNNAFIRVGTDKDGFQRWQLTPDPGDKNYYRFVNRGLGEGKSLEVVDDNFDSSVAMSRTAIDTGQLWAITNVEGDYYRITNQWLGDVKSLSHFKRHYYFLRIRDTSVDDDGQLWKKVPAAADGSFYLVNKQHGEKLTLEAYSSREFLDKLALTANNPGFSPDNRWKEKDVGSGLVTLTTVYNELNNTNKLLAANPNKNDRVAMTAAASSPGQRWKLTPVGSDGYFRLTNGSLGDGKSLEAVAFVNYYLEMVKTSDEDTGQLWRLSRTDK